jgi:hypothetical protein
MTNNSHAPLSPADRIKHHSRILHALREAVREALLKHKRSGNPVAGWQNDRVVWAPAEQIPLDGHDE